MQEKELVFSKKVRWKREKMCEEGDEKRDRSRKKSDGKEKTNRRWKDGRYKQGQRGERQTKMGVKRYWKMRKDTGAVDGWSRAGTWGKETGKGLERRSTERCVVSQITAEEGNMSQVVKRMWRGEAET